MLKKKTTTTKKKKITEKLDPNMSIVSNNNESEVPAKKDLGSVGGVFSCANGHKQLYVTSSGLNHVSPRFRKFFHIALPVWVIRGC